MIHTEIYDDTSSPCFMSTFGQAPYNASYDVHFVSTLGNGLHHYGAYFQAPSGSTQYLAYGDMHAQGSAAFADGEVSSWPPSSGPLYCTRLGATSGGENIFGYAQADLSLASTMSLNKNGSWMSWTSSAAPTSAFLWPPNGSDYYGAGRSSNPYVLQGVSNFSAGNYTEWASGGPTP